MTTPTNPAPEEQQPEQQPEQPPIAPIKPDTGTEDPDTGRYAAYDTRLGRYVGGVHDSEAKAKRAARDAGVKSGDTTIREV